MSEVDFTYPIHEMFYTFQGEGSAMGLPAFFVRTFGCPVHCPFCDSAGTWHPHWVPKNVRRYSAQFIAGAAHLESAPIVVVTGGEPCIFDLGPLVEACQQKQMDVHLETSGSFPIQGDFDHIVLSPKRWRLPLAESVRSADEFKIIVEAPEDIPFYLKALMDLGLKAANDTRQIWLHPEWSKREDRAVLSAIIETVKRNTDGRVRAGWQLHKLYKVDQMDERVLNPVPLGGDLLRGY